MEWTIASEDKMDYFFRNYLSINRKVWYRNWNLPRIKLHMTQANTTIQPSNPPSGCLVDDPNGLAIASVEVSLQYVNDAELCWFYCLSHDRGGFQLVIQSTFNGAYTKRSKGSSIKDAVILKFSYPTSPRNSAKRNVFQKKNSKLFSEIIFNIDWFLRWILPCYRFIY